MSGAISRSSAENRPIEINAAAVLMAILSLSNIIINILLALNPGSMDDVPTFVIYATYTLGAIGLLTTVGLWRRRKWAMIVAFVVAALNFLISVPGIPFGPTTLATVSSGIAVLMSAAIVILLLRRDARASFG